MADSDVAVLPPVAPPPTVDIPLNGTSGSGGLSGAATAPATLSSKELEAQARAAERAALEEKIEAGAVKVPLLRSCTQEVLEPIDAVVRGVIPSWLQGSLLRNGPGNLKVGQDRFSHIFDGLALLHRINIQNGEVTYQNRFLQSETYKSNTNAGRIVVTEFGPTALPDPCVTLLNRMMSKFKKPQFGDNALINIYPIGDEIFATSETPYIHRIDPTTLETISPRVDLSKWSSAINSVTAHPHRDERGALFNIGLALLKKTPSHQIIRIPGEDKGYEKATVVASIPLIHTFRPAYVHSFSVTENYFIFIDQSFVVDLKAVAMGQVTGNGPLHNAFVFDPARKSRFWLVHRKLGRLINVSYVTEAFAFFHTINAYEEDDHIVVDLCAYPNAALMSEVYTEFLARGAAGEISPDSLIRGHVRRYVLPLNIAGAGPVGESVNLITLAGSDAKAFFNKKGQVRLEYESPFAGQDGVTDETIDLPRIHYERFNGRKYQYFYAVGRRAPFSSEGARLVKGDLLDRTFKSWSEPGAIPSEPIFVPRPDPVSEDDGVVISLVLTDSDQNSGYLLVLDAQTFGELGRASFTTPSPLPADIHGLFLSHN